MTLRLTLKEVYQTAKNQYSGVSEFSWLSIILICLFAVIESYLNYQTMGDKNPAPIIVITLAITSILSAITLWGMYYRVREYMHGHSISAFKQPWIGLVKILKGILAFILASICITIATIPLVIICFVLHWVGTQFGLAEPAVILCGTLSFFYLSYILLYLNLYFFTVIFEDRNIFACVKITIKMLYGNWWHWVFTTLICAVVFVIISGLLFVTILTPNLVIHGVAIAIDFILLAAYLPFLISIVITEYNNLKSYRHC